MSILSEQIKELRTIANNLSIGHNMPISLAIERFRQAADTIEALSAKLQAANMERSETKFNDDLISRNEILRRIDSRIADYRHDCNSGWQKYADWYEYDVRPLVRDFQSINAPSYDGGGWIACEKKMPEIGKPVLVCDKQGNVCVRTITCQIKGKKYWSQGKNDVVAWCELPEPYCP